MVPVLTSLPVVFVDQFGDHDEDPTLGRTGETLPLRRLLAARVQRADERMLIDTRHVTVQQLDRALLSTARLVVVAGVANPAGAAQVLREYVEQGGSLLLAAGGDFDPAAWNREAWQSGQGLLPARLREIPMGQTPEAATGTLLKPFSLAMDGPPADPLLRLPGLSDEELSGLYQEPMFFRAVATDSGVSQANGGAIDAVPDRRQAAHPDWLAWKSPVLDAGESTDSLPAHTQPRTHWRVAARFNDKQHTPFLVAGRIGKGVVVFASSSILPTWNNLAQTNAVLLWDHVMRSLIRSTLPIRNFTPREQLAVPLPIHQRNIKVQLRGPGRRQPHELLDVAFVARDQVGVSIPHAWTRGLYHLQLAPNASGKTIPEPSAWHVKLAVNGEASESNLTSLSEDEFRTRIVDSGVGRRLADNSLVAIGLANQAGSLWWWLVLATFILLVVELVLLGTSRRARSATGSSIPSMSRGVSEP